MLESRDIDAVGERFAHWVRRRNRFGGLQISRFGWRIDAWPIETTWAFRAGLVPYDGAESLTFTTFLNVEAVAVDLRPYYGRQRRVFENGFFESVRSRTLDINLEQNPFPELCVVRALLTAARLGFSLSPRLLRYIGFHTEGKATSELLDVQRSHYGRVRRDSPEVSRWLDAVRRHLDSACETPLTLPSTGLQLEMWDDLTRDLVGNEFS